MLAAIVLLAIGVSLAVTEASGVTHLATTLLRIATGSGTLVVEVDDPQVSITIDGQDLVITGAGPREVRLKPGQYRVQATKDGKAIQEELVRISRGRKQVVKVSVEPAGAAPTAAQARPAPGEVRRFVGHVGIVYSVAISPDGRQALSGGEDGTARLWDLESGQEINRFDTHPAGARAPAGAAGERPWSVTSVAFSADGRQALFGVFDGPVRLWNLQTWKEVRRFGGHAGGLWSVAFSGDSRYALTAGGDATVRLWDLASGTERRRFEGHTGGVWRAIFSPDRQRVLSSGQDGTVRLWDAGTGKTLRSFDTKSGNVVSIAFSPDGQRILSGDDHQWMRLWAVENGKELRRFPGHGGWVFGLIFSRDGRQALSGCHDGMVRLWDVENGLELVRFDDGAKGPVWSTAWSPDGRHVLSSGADGVLRLWALADLAEDRPTVDRYRGWSQRELAERLDELSKSIRSNPQDAYLVEERGRLYAHLGRYDDAARDFIRANELLASPWGWEHSSSVFKSLMEHEEVFARIAELRPTDRALWAHRGHYYAMRGQWERALPDYLRGGDEERFCLFSYACVLLLTGDMDAYRAVCERMAAQSGQTDQPDVALHLVMGSSSGTRSGIDPARIAEWAQLALRAGRNKFTLEALALACYRAGEFDQTVTLLHEAMDLPDPMPKSEAAFPLALAYRGLGQEENSRKWFKLGVAELENVTPRDPDHPVPWSPRQWLNVNVWYREAKAVFEPAAAATADSPERRHAVACRHHESAQELLQAGRADEAEKEFRQAFDIWDKLRAEWPDRRQYRQNAAWTLYTIGQLRAAAKGTTEAEQCYRRALGDYERLAAEYPAEAGYRQEMAFICGLWGNLLKDSSRIQEAETFYRQAVAIHEKLVAELPAVATYRSRLSANLGELAENLLQQGKHAEAAKVAEKMPGTMPENPDAYQRAADFFSRCVPLAEKDATLPEADRRAVAQRYADRSAELMQEAARRSEAKPVAPGQKPKQ